MSLQKNAMIVKLTISQYSGKKKDKRLDANAAAACHTETAFLDARKHIIDKAMFKTIEKAANKIRNRHYDLTIPWSHNGEALLPAKLFWQYTQEMRELKDAFYSTVENFVNNYEIYKSDARLRLGDIFDESDYPPLDVIRNSFGVNFSFLPIPSANHFVVEIEQSEIQGIKQSLQDELSAAESEAMGKLWDRVYALVDRAYTTLSDPERIFKDSLVDDLTQYVELVPALNVLNNKDLNRVIELMKEQLCGHSADQLRHDLDVREKVALQALKIRQFMEKVSKNHVSSNSLKAAA
jgi:hypothetical protein